MTVPPLTFIIGIGRSGSTVIQQVLARHHSTAWLSGLCDTRPALNRALMRALDVPGIAALLARRYEPEECYAFWDSLYPGFSTPCRDLVADDVTEGVRRRVRAALGAMVTARRPHLLVKITGWPRLGFLHEIFPDAKFIHVFRDGRAVVSSLLNVSWWWGWRGPSNWRWGELPPAYEELWHRHGKSFIALAGIQWILLMEALDRARQAIEPGRLLDLCYEDVCADPARHLRTAVEFAGLEWSARFEAEVRRAELRSENEKWRREFTPAQQKMLQDLLGPHLERYGYA